MNDLIAPPRFTIQVSRQMSLFAPNPVDTLEAYKQMLREHDWLFEFSDDHRAWLVGRAQLRWLKSVQPTVDPQWVLWNAAAPVELRIPTAFSNSKEKS